MDNHLGMNRGMIIRRFFKKSVVTCLKDVINIVIYN